MAEMTVSAKKRDNFGSGASRRLRREGMVPGIVYGGAVANVPVTVDPKDIVKLLRSHAGRNTILSMNIDDGESDSVILKELQVDPVKEDILHVDFQRIAMDETLRVTVPIAIQGTAVGVKTEGGMLDIVQRQLEVECLPGDIPDQIDCDVTELHLNQSIRVSDLPTLRNVQILEDADQVIVHVVSVRAEEEAAPAEAEEAAEAAEGEPELIARGKKEEEE